MGWESHFGGIVGASARFGDFVSDGDELVGFTNGATAVVHSLPKTSDPIPVEPMRVRVPPTRPAVFERDELVAWDATELGGAVFATSGGDLYRTADLADEPFAGLGVGAVSGVAVRGERLVILVGDEILWADWPAAFVPATIMPAELP